MNGVLRSKGPIDSMAGCVPVRICSSDAQPQIMLVKLQKKKKTLKFFNKKNVDSIKDIRNTKDYDNHFNIEWAIPRGRKKRRESAEETAQRESKKQMGLTGQITSYLGDFYHSGEHAVIKTYIMCVCDKQKWKSEDCRKIRRWFTLAEAEAAMVGPILSEIWRRIVLLHSQNNLIPSPSNSQHHMTIPDETSSRGSQETICTLSDKSVTSSHIYTPPAKHPACATTRHLPLFKTFFIDFEHVNCDPVSLRRQTHEWAQSSRKVSFATEVSRPHPKTSTCWPESSRSSSSVSSRFSSLTNLSLSGSLSSI